MTPIFWPFVSALESRLENPPTDLTQEKLNCGLIIPVPVPEAHTSLIVPVEPRSRIDRSASRIPAASFEAGCIATIRRNLELILTVPAHHK